MKLLPLLLLVCFVLYEVLQVEGKSKQNVVKKLLQKYIHHHKHPHHHKHHHHHVHHHHKHHHHHHHHKAHPHHKHWHHHHHHHHKSFHQKLVEQLKKEKQQHHVQNAVNQRATKRQSLPQLLVSLGKGFMQLGQHLGNNESHADVQAKGSTIRHAPTPKPMVHDHVATTQAATRAFATPSPTSEYDRENDNSDDIGGAALTSAPPTPTVSQKVTTFDGDAPQSNDREMTVHMPHPKNIDSSIITPTPQSEPSPRPSPKPQGTTYDDISSPTDDKQKPMKPTVIPTASRISKLNQDPSVKLKMASDSDKENEPISSQDRVDKAKDIDEHRDSSIPKIPKVKEEESIPNPSIEIPADQARSLEYSPTESAIDGRAEDESSHNEQDSHFGTSQTSNENPSPNLFVSEKNIGENVGQLRINATQNIDKVMETNTEDDISSNDETKGSATRNTNESPNKLDGDQVNGLSQTKSEDTAKVVETTSEDSQAEESIDGKHSAEPSGSNTNTEFKTEANSTASNEIMDGEVLPTEIESRHNSMDDLSSKATTFSPTAALKSSMESVEGNAKPSSQDSDSTTDRVPAQPLRSQDSESTSVDGTTQPSGQQDSDHKVTNQASHEINGSINEVTQSAPHPDDDLAAKSPSEELSGSTKYADQNAQPTAQTDSSREELARLPTQQSDSITDGEVQFTSQSVSNNSLDGLGSAHGDDDIMVGSGASEPSSHDTGELKDASLSTLGTNNTAEVTKLVTTSSGTNGDDVKTGERVAIPQSSKQDSEYFQNASQSGPVSNSTLVTGDSDPSVSDYVPTQESNDQSTSTAATPLKSSDHSHSDDIVGGPPHKAPVFQSNTTLDGQEYDETKLGETAQLSDVPVDEAFNPTGEHLAMDNKREEEQNKVTNNAVKNYEEHQEKVNSFPSEIEDGEVRPPTYNTVPPKTEEINTYSNSNVPAIYN